MRAVLVEQFGPFDQASVEEVPDPVPGPGELLVDLHAAEVNELDLLVITGTSHAKPPLPFSPGKAGAGVVAAVGQGISGLAPGDLVALQVEHGAWAEKVAVPARSCFRLPDGISFNHAAALGLTYQTAWFALRDRARYQPGEVILVLGAAGGVGVAAIQLAKAWGSLVIAGARGGHGAEVARRAGADQVVDLAKPDLGEGLRAAVQAATDGHGADVVIDPVGGEAHAAAMRALAWRGRMVVVAFASGDGPSIEAHDLLTKNIAVSGLQWSDYRERTPDWVQDAQQEIFELYLAGKLEPVIAGTFPLERVADALRMVATGEARGRVILEMGSGDPLPS